MESSYLKTAAKAVKEAEKIIMHYYDKAFDVEIKTDQTPVTLADKEAEEIIIKTIKETFPDHAFLGEESGISNNNSEFIWIIDPIDGTFNFMRRVPLFATQLALMKDNELILGISNAPASNEMLWAEKGEGAFLNGKKIKVSTVDKLSRSYLSFGVLKQFQKTKQLDNLTDLISKTFSHRGIGDFWSFHLLAEGKIDIMIEAETGIWDIAALTVIIEEAGGIVTDITGKPVTIETNSIIASNKYLHKQCLNHFCK